MRYLHTTFLMILAICLSASPLSAAEKSEKTVQDLPYGEVLFHFYKQDYFTALVDLLIAQELERVPNHVRDSELLAGGMYLSYGMPEKAEKIFQQLLENEQPQDVQDRSWYFLGKIAYQRGDAQSSINYLDRISAELPDKLLGNNRLMRALIAMQQNDYRTAVAQLQDWKGDKQLAPFVQYNLGVAELKSGSEQAGIDRLDKLGREKFKQDEETLLAVKDKANLAAGFYLLDKKQSVEARTYIDRIRLNGPLSSQALLGAGWTDIEQNADLSALIPWQVLSERNVLDPLVQETLIAIPLAWSKAGAHGKAAEAYERAIEVFSNEIQRLDQSMEGIRSGKFIDYLVDQDDKVELGWMRDLKVTAAAPEPFYMDDLLSSHRSQESLKNYRDLWFLKNNLQQWQQSVSAYDEMLSLRWQRFQLFVPQAKDKLERLGLEGYERQYQQLSDYYHNAVETENWLDFATKEELQQWDTMEALQAQLDADPGIENHQELQQKVNFYKGILIWQLNAVQPDRRWQIKKQLGIIGEELTRTRAFVASITAVLQDLPAGFEGFDLRILEDKETITRLQEKVDQTMTRQADVLIQQALKILGRHRNRLDTLNLKAGFALAQIYDRAANPEAIKK